MRYASASGACATPVNSLPPSFRARNTLCLPEACEGVAGPARRAERHRRGAQAPEGNEGRTPQAAAAPRSAPDLRSRPSVGRLREEPHFLGLKPDLFEIGSQLRALDQEDVTR